MITYSSTDVGAPALPDVNGSTNALLYACLCTGYGSKPGAGWTREFTGTNLAVFKQGAGGNGRYLRVFDGGRDASTNRRVNLRAYESMTAVSTGTGPFPTTGQVSGNGATFVYFFAGAANPTWKLYATSSWFHLIVDGYPDATYAYREYMGFGTFVSYKPGNVYCDVLIAGATNTQSSNWEGYLVQEGSPTTSSQGMYLCRSDTGAAGAVLGAALVDSTVQASYVGGHTLPYPDRPTGALLQGRVHILAQGYRQGYIPGMWATLHSPAALAHDQVNGTTWTGAAGTPLAGKAFRMDGPLATYAVGDAAYVTLETSNTWDS